MPVRAKVAHLWLCHSRHFLVIAYPREIREIVFDAHMRAFEFFGGVCRRGIYDNLKTVVNKVLSYSVNGEQVGPSVQMRVYAERIVIVSEGQVTGASGILAEARRSSISGITCPRWSESRAHCATEPHSSTGIFRRPSGASESSCKTAIRTGAGSMWASCRTCRFTGLMRWRPPAARPSGWEPLSRRWCLTCSTAAGMMRLQRRSSRQAT